MAQKSEQNCVYISKQKIKENHKHKKKYDWLRYCDRNIDIFGFGPIIFLTKFLVFFLTYMVLLLYAQSKGRGRGRTQVLFSGVYLKTPETVTECLVFTSQPNARDNQDAVETEK